MRAHTDQSKIARGRWGEDLAARFYERRGYTVLDRNWRSPRGELDLVLELDGTIVFSEVKARRTARYGSPAEAVGPDKQRRIRLLGLDWLHAHGLGRRTTRFDVVAITGVEIKLYEGAF
ncbi:YraN family protein [Ilumatobacter coccineus]|jgi:putative endonuclease|uniref:UPF0102 protein YM304_18780 n=1 Tax=Ilumatobacter coccineus (strain NBRC 103263 / KCTC 29153 / YM16-304) TaxID=1313172 RepID=A0A6C7E833_ILUCY|nr:YraN family protein [Ilumatobacter coccineus]BAN02192.1 hypothetical protein YM304_18780 [Ilumatobacter coccineus YM16-304]